MAYQNFYATKLQNPIGASDTTITVQTAPTALSGRLVLDPRNTQTREIISYTGVSGTDLTGVTRGLYGTTAQPHLAGVLTEMNFLAEDYQDLVDAFNNFSGLNASGWNAMVDLPNTVVANGQKSYTLTYTGVDVTNLLSPGTRLRTTRTVAAPTQSTSLNGTTQYWQKTSPNKLTFTDDFVVSAWVKLNSYGATGTIVSRYNGTSGWALQILDTGTVYLVGYNAGSGNFSRVLSVKSVPLGRWVHIAAQLDMSAFTATTTTSYVMFDGVDVPATVNRAGTNPTALVQAGNLEVGAVNGATFFPGKIAQVAIYSAKVTQANILATIDRGLSGSETSLASAYSFNGVATDLMVTTPNDLTAQASATATNADSPFGIQASGLVSSTLDYGIVQAASFSTDSTVVVQVPEGNTIPSSGGVAAVSYSNMKAPYGMPVDRGRWELISLFRVDQTLTSNATFGSFGGGGWALTVPIGAFEVGYSLPAYNTTLTVVYFSISDTPQTGLAADAQDTRLAFRLQSPATQTYTMYATGSTFVNLTAQDTFVIYTLGATTSAGVTASDGNAKLTAINAYL